MINMVRGVLPASPNFLSFFHLYCLLHNVTVTGHSLGASLSSIFAFCAANSDEIPKPVTCVSVASTYVGGCLWRKQFSVGTIHHSQHTFRNTPTIEVNDVVLIIPCVQIIAGIGEERFAALHSCIELARRNFPRTLH